MSDNTVKKQSFFGGAAVLAVATAIVKVIGMFFKIPLQQIIGEAGYGYFTTAYDIYSVLLMISTAGLPVAMSRMISEAQALEQYNQIRKIYQVSLRVFLTLGLVGFLGMAIFCKQLAVLMGQANAWYAVLALSPAVLFIGLISSYRGWFQGQSNMTPTSISQVMEALCKLLIGLLAAWFIVGRLDNIPLAAGGAILGVTIGCVVSATYLHSRRSRSARLLPEGGAAKSGKATLRQLLAIAIPITIGAAGLQLITLVDTVIYMHRLKTAAGFSQAEADVLKGIYNYCQTIFNLPCSLIVPISVSIIPALTAHLTTKNQQGAAMVRESSIRVTALLAMPCAVGLAVLSTPVYHLLSSGSSEESLRTAGPILSVLGITVLFNAIVLVTNAIMQAHGDVKTPVINMLIGGVLKVIINFILVGNPSINILGAAIGTLCCYILITTLNLFAMRRTIGVKLPMHKLVLKPLIASLGMGAAAWFAYRAIHTVIASSSLSCLAAIVAAVVVYALLVLVLRIITMEDCMLLPKGEKIAKILHIREK